mmetsp:Transcript_106611/g.308943  ORF Transcript_106611/g.308943 Transcript_106611/m.308943 type:complete len:257 (-) Transcript_106611:1925-2695(-)
MSKEWVNCTTNSLWFPILIIMVILHSCCICVFGRDRNICSEQYVAATPCCSNDERDNYSDVYVNSWPFIFPGFVLLICAYVRGFHLAAYYIARSLCECSTQFPITKYIPHNSYTNGWTNFAFEQGKTSVDGGYMKDFQCGKFFTAGYCLFGLVLLANLAFLGNLKKTRSYCSRTPEDAVEAPTSEEDASAIDQVELQQVATPQIPKAPEASAAAIQQLTELYNRASVGELGCMVEMATLIDQHAALADQDITKVEN